MTIFWRLKGSLFGIFERQQLILFKFVCLGCLEMAQTFIRGKTEVWVALLLFKNPLYQRSRLGWNFKGFAPFMIILFGRLQEKEGGQHGNASSHQIKFKVKWHLSFFILEVQHPLVRTYRTLKGGEPLEGLIRSNKDTCMLQHLQISPLHQRFECEYGEEIACQRFKFSIELWCMVRYLQLRI